MASVLIDNYYIEYSVRDGSIKEFTKNDRPVTENYDEELIAVSKRIIKAQSKNMIGYSAFIYKLVEEGKLRMC